MEKEKVLQGKSQVSGYNVQYWLYAILDKEYGDRVSLRRSYIHDKYAVNRHDFYASGISTKEVATFLKKNLIASGYVKDENWIDVATLPEGDSGLRMTNTYSYPKKDVEVHILLNKTISSSEISISIFVYKKLQK